MSPVAKGHLPWNDTHCTDILRPVVFENKELPMEPVLYEHCVESARRM